MSYYYYYLYCVLIAFFIIINWDYCIFIITYCYYYYFKDYMVTKEELEAGAFTNIIIIARVINMVTISLFILVDISYFGVNYCFDTTDFKFDN